jgi:hypothetical protein
MPALRFPSHPFYGLGLYVEPRDSRGMTGLGSAGRICGRFCQLLPFTTVQAILFLHELTCFSCPGPDLDQDPKDFERLRQFCHSMTVIHVSLSAEISRGCALESEKR